jgi:hypothetical protein
VEYLKKYLLPRQHEDNLRAYRGTLTQLSTLTQYADLWDKLWTAFVRAGVTPDEPQWLWDIRKGLSKEEDRRVITLAMCKTVSEMTGMIRLLDDSPARKGGRKEEGGRKNNRGFYRRDKEDTHEGRETKKGRVFSIQESDSELESEDSEEEMEISDGERVAVVITNLEKRELGPMTRDLRDLRKKKGLCMFCGAHQQKEGQKCPNYERLRLTSVRTNEDPKGYRKPSSKSRKTGVPAGGRKKEKNFSVRQSDSSSEPEEDDDEEEEEVSAVNVRRTARSRSLSTGRSNKPKNP